MMLKITLVFCLLSTIFATEIKRLVVDVDAGVDDYQALVLLLYADNQNLIKLEAIVCTKGNTEVTNVLKNVYRLLETANRTDIPVYSGSYHELIPNLVPGQKWYGEDGFADLEYKKMPNVDKAQKLIAPVTLYNLMQQNPNKISIIILGPSTNVALALTMYKSFANMIKEIIIMGGNYKVKEAEFNVLGDPESTKIVLSIAKCPIAMFTWQACIEDPIPFSWRFGLRNISNPVWDLADRAERKIFAGNKLTDMWTSCDALTAFLVLYPDAIKEQSKHYATVALLGKDRGLIIIDDKDKEPNLNIIERIDVNRFKTVFVNSFVGICNTGKCKYLF